MYEWADDLVVMFGFFGRLIYHVCHRSGVSLVIDAGEGPEIHLGVDLGGADVSMSKHLLDSAQIAA